MDNYNCVNDPPDTTEKFYGYEYAYWLGDDIYFDQWKGTKWQNKNDFCYNAYGLSERDSLESLTGVDPTTINVYSSLDTASTRTDRYINTPGEETNLLDLYKKACLTTYRSNNGKYELLINMDKEIQKTDSYDFYFTIVNPTIYNSNFNIYLRTFVNHTYIESEEKEETQKDKDGNDIIVTKTIDVEKWEILEERFDVSSTHILNAHTMEQVKVSLMFQDDGTVISEGFGHSEAMFYFKTAPKVATKNFTKLEFIVSSNRMVGVSTYSLMHRRESLTESYMGADCKNSDSSQTFQCGEGYTCISKSCQKCNDVTCNDCNGNKSGACSKCFSISIKEQWDSPDTSDKYCHLDYLDLAKVTINEDKGYIVPPAIHWRVTTDFWIFITNPHAIEGRNLNIIYKDFFAITLTPSQDGLKIFATPIEWLYEYPATDEGPDSDYYKEYVEPTKSVDIVSFLKNTVGSYDIVTLKDVIPTSLAVSNWLYIRFAFNLDSSKQYLNELPESNLQVAQLYKGQTNFPFHMKKFYQRDNNTYLFFQHFHLDSDQDTNIYVRNFNIFRDYIPRNIVTKFFNLHLIDSPKKMPQLLASFPFSNVMKKGAISGNNGRKLEMKGYQYFIRDKDGKVIEETTGTTKVPQEDTYEVIVDSTVESLVPPRNFWRLNFLDLNKQATNCDYNNYQNILCSDTYCFEDEMPFSCNVDNTYPYYLDIEKVKCQQFCPIGYMHPPRYSKYLQRQYCSYKCDEANKQCPSDKYKYTDTFNYFLCPNNFFNLYYKCFSKDDSINDIQFSGIFFSTALNTPTIEIDLQTSYDEYAIDFWYYPDIRLRQKRYLKDKTYNPNTYDKELYIFLTDHLKVQYGSVNSHTEGNNKEAYTVSSALNPTNWNHFIFTYYKETLPKKGAAQGFLYYASFANRQYEGTSYPVTSLKAKVTTTTLSKILFCQNDKTEYEGFKNMCEKIQWLDGYYRKLQIFNITYSAKNPIYFMHQFEDDLSNGFLRHRYIYGLNTVVNNHLIDTISGKDGYVLFAYEKDIDQNLDKTNYIIYESNFSPQSALYTTDREQKYVLSYRYSPPEIQLQMATSKKEHCDIVQDGTYCLSCKKGYSLFSSYCMGNERDDSLHANYYYKNPGKNMPDRVSLDINVEKINASPYFTLFFFIKLYGIITRENEPRDEIKKLIILHELKDSQGAIKDDLYLGYRALEDANEIFFGWKGNTTLFSLSNATREKHFGHWIPVSLTAYRSPDITFHSHMSGASYNYENYDVFYVNTEGGMPYLQLTQFTITNRWVGLLSEVRVYDRLIINAWGVIRHYKEDQGLTHDDVPNSVIASIPLKSEEPGGCLENYQILSNPSESYKVECTIDYNQHLFDCGDMEASTVWYHQGDSSSIGVCSNCGENALALCSANCQNSWQLPRCLGGRGSGITLHAEDKDVIQTSCENKSPSWKNYVPGLQKGKYKRLVCSSQGRIDYNRFNHAESSNVKSPDDVWAMDFWFITRCCSNNFKRTGNDDNGVKINFEEFVIEWNYHIRFKIYAKKDDDNQNNNQYTYYASCKPIIVMEQHDLDTDEEIVLYLKDKSLHRVWQYVACGVHFNEKKFYLTKKNAMAEEYPFVSKLTSIPTAPTNMTLDENSRPGYGMTHIMQLRFWNCYDCAHGFRNFAYDKLDKNFVAVLHCFTGSNPNTAGPRQYFTDIAGEATEYAMHQAENYPGLSLIPEIGNYTLCDESIYTYYDNITDKCIRQFNLARIEDFKVSIPSSRNNRYTMEFWFFAEKSSELSPGFNVIWDKHMSITILRDSSNQKTINAICFPQNYLDNVDGLGGQQVLDLYDKAINKDKFPFYQSSSTWNFVRCAVDQTRKLFYLNDNVELDMEGEILYGGTRNYRPFRYFNISKNEYLKFQNINKNPTRVFMRQVRTYREFLDYKLMDMKFIRCDRLSIASYEFWPITFCFDLADSLEGANWVSSSSREGFFCKSRTDCGLVYYLISENSDESIKIERKQWYDLLRSDIDLYYSSYPSIYSPNFCEHGQMGGDATKCSGTTYLYRMRGNSRYFFPDSNNHFLNLETLQVVTTCPTDSCRPPDTSTKRSYCLFSPGDNNMLKCQSRTYSNYNTDFKCKTGYQKVFYECIDKSLVSGSSMYFSNAYSFPNLVYKTTSPTDGDTSPYKKDGSETRIMSYYIEAWIKLDTINHGKDVTELEHYLYAYPHRIIKDPEDQKFKYSNLEISYGSYFYTLSAINYYEWNRIIIENYYDKDNDEFSIKLYLNYEFDNPELTILNLKSDKYFLHFRGLAFCDKKDNFCRIKSTSEQLTWGAAWYKNIRIWEEEITSLQLIQSCEYGYTELINAQKYYWPMTIDYLDRYMVKDRINSYLLQLNYWYYYTGTSWRSEFDNDFRENYSIENFDYTYVNENNYITGLTEDGKDYIISECSQECKRCYSSSSNDCYECRLGYSLFGKQCKIRTGYFFKTPPTSYASGYKKVSLQPDGSFDISTQSPLTITIWIKFFGIKLNATPTTGIYFPMIYLKGDATFIGYNPNDKAFVLIIDSQEIYSVPAKKYIGNWAHFGISFHKSNAAVYDYFPHMVNFMVGQEIIIPKMGFNPTTTEFTISEFSIDFIPICYYSSLKFFSTFYFGPYGHINAIASTRGSLLITQINLYGSANNNCISNAQIINSASLNLKSICVTDYHPYEDTNNICSSDKDYIDIKLKVIPPCDSCDKICTTNCFYSGSNSCTCNYQEGLFWVKTDKDYQSYQCQKVDSINFAFFNPVTLNGISVVTNDEMTLEFWLDIYQYKDGKFNKLNIIWNHHLEVAINGGNPKLEVECKGDAALDETLIAVSTASDTNVDFNKWVFIRCSIDKYHQKMKVNGLPEENYTPITYSNSLLTTSLLIQDFTENFNYGFSMVRELRLYSSYNYDFWVDSGYTLDPKNYPYMLHSFTNSFNGSNLEESKIIDLVSGIVTKLEVKDNRIGYNYVIDYEYIMQCAEGYVYNELAEKCKVYTSDTCTIPRDSDDHCLKCPPSKPYLKDDDKCYKDCSPEYYQDDYLLQCRKCDETCYTCFGKYPNNCLSCIGEYNYIESLHICVKNCQEYGLVVVKPNVCSDLISGSKIVVPVYLNNSYDYNPENEDYTTKIVDQKTFNEITGEVSFSSASSVETEWIFSREETLKENSEYRYYNELDIPETDPITSDPTDLHITVDNAFFRHGYKYVFFLKIISRKDAFETTNLHKYILIMNDYPKLGLLNILPSAGYISTNFLLTINECKDDYSKKSKLKYKFTYVTKKSDAIGGYDESPEEILMQDWSDSSEVLWNFEIPGPEKNTYYVKGYCKDEYDLYYSEIKELPVYDVPTESGKDLPLNETHASIDVEKTLDAEQLSNRAEFISTTTVDFPKSAVILDRVDVTDFTKTGILQKNLILYDPVSNPKDLFCNKRGDSLVLYYYLICDCSGYLGSACQIDQQSFQWMIDNYYKIYEQVKQLQTGQYNFYLLNAIHLLVKSAAAFFPIENKDFMLNSIDFINLYMSKFVNEMLFENNYEVYFDIYNYLIEYGLSIINQLKHKNCLEFGICGNRDVQLDETQALVVNSYFKRVKEGLENLLDFYANNKKEVRFINSNINVYVSIINENYETGSFWQKEQSLYEPFFNFERCIENIMISSQGSPTYKLFMTAIVWKVSPYMSSKDLYWDSSSPIISFKFIDYKTGNKIYLNGCGEVSDYIQLYFPVATYVLPSTINKYRDYLSPENQYSTGDDIFNDPVYINKSGAVFNTTPEERQQTFFVGFNFSCQYYKTSSDNPDNVTLSNETLDFNEYTKENYVKCLAQKVIQERYSEFVVLHYPVPANFHINSRFFYLKHPMLLFWKENYKENQSLIYFLVVIGFYVAMSIIYIFIEKKVLVKLQELKELRTTIAKINMPYRKRYLFSNDLNIDTEAKGKLKDVREDDEDEMNLDINHLNINTMAKEVSKYNKTYEDKENALGFSPNINNIKQPPKPKVKSQFFPSEMGKGETPNETNLNKRYQDDPNRIEGLRKHFDVGFKGLENKEKESKEIKFDDQAKKIYVGKKDNLDTISENSEDIKDYGAFFNENEPKVTKKAKSPNILDEVKKFNERRNNDKDNDNDDDDGSYSRKKKHSRRNKFFGQAPPKKTYGAIMDSLVFKEHEAKKQVNASSHFYQDKLVGNKRNKSKIKMKQKANEKEELDKIYKTKLAENLGFYNKELEYDFELDVDKENIKPPYFGTRLHKKKFGEKDDGEGGNKRKVGFRQRNQKYEDIDYDDLLPQIPIQLTLELLMEEFHSTSALFDEFLIRNIKNRHILFTTFGSFSLFYPRYQRVGNFAAQLSLFALLMSICFTADAQQTIYTKQNTKEILYFILYCLLSEIGACILVHIPAFCFYINDKKIRKLYNLVRVDGGINVLRETERVNKEGRLCWIVLGVVLQIIFILGGFYFAFGFCSTYYYQRTTFILALICTVCFDIFIGEFFWEILIALLFYFRNLGRCMVFFGAALSKLRNIKHLV